MAYKRPSIWVFTVVKNEERLAPWFLRHYGEFADSILVWDAGSTDATRPTFAAHPTVRLFDWPGPIGIDDTYNLNFAYRTYPSARGQADWVMWVDIDEFIWAPNLLGTLHDMARGVEVIQPRGYNMVGNGLPENEYEYKQIWHTMTHGVEAPVYAKPVIFRPGATVRWKRGRHELEFCNPVVERVPEIKLLHYRYLGREYTRVRNARNYALAGKQAGWSNAPERDGPDLEHTPAWAEAAKAKAFNVLEA